MNAIDLIKKSVQAQLERDGYSSGVALRYSTDAAEHFKAASSFKNGAYAACLLHARNNAKQGASKCI